MKLKFNIIITDVLEGQETKEFNVNVDPSAIKVLIQKLRQDNPTCEISYYGDKNHYGSEKPLQMIEDDYKVFRNEMTEGEFTEKWFSMVVK